MPRASLRVFEVPNQRAALQQLAELTERATVHPQIRAAAAAIVSDCPARDDICEIQAVFDAVKHGTQKVPGLERGLRYLADPRWADYFSAPAQTLKQCVRGACAGDCDDASSLIASLLGSLGFRVGLRAWAKPGTQEFEHVYAVVGVPKRAPRDVLGLDTTVPDSSVGWEPPIDDSNHILTAWLT